MFELNDNENITSKLWYAEKVGLRKEFISLNAYINKG